MISAKVMACSPGEMAASMMDNGKMANNMEKEYLSRMKAPEESESGRVDATLNGQIQRKQLLSESRESI